MYAEINKFLDLAELRNLEVVNLGTGMGYYDFCYDDLDVKAFNFSLPQQNLQFDYNLLKYYHKYLQKNCKVCIVLPYFIFAAHYFDELRDVYNRYYALLPQEQVEPYCNMSCSEFNSIYNKQKGTEVLELLDALDEASMKIQSKEAISNWEHKLKLVSCMSGKVSEHVSQEMQETKKWLKNILEFCILHQFQPIIIVPPMSSVLLEWVSTEFRRTHFYEPLEEIVDDSVEILDYTENRKFCEPHLYGWPGFLIKEAAKDFTKDVLVKTGVMDTCNGT